MKIYCTLFDEGYIAKGVVLAESLLKQASKDRLYILCMDNNVKVILDHLALPAVINISLAELEGKDQELLEVKNSRSTAEYYFTCKASLMKHILYMEKDCERVTYLDADLCFYSDPCLLDDEINKSSVAVIDHRFSRSNDHLYQYGRFNAGWLSIRNDVEGKACVDWWRNRCLEWCYDRAENEKYADQKYMDKFPHLFNAVEVKNIGANLAPWNIGNYKLTFDNKILVDGKPVIFFHFHGIKHLFGNMYESGLASFNQKLSVVAQKQLFIPYMKKCCVAELKIENIRKKLDKQDGFSVLKKSRHKVKRGTLIKRIIKRVVLFFRYLRFRTFFNFDGC